MRRLRDGQAVSLEVEALETNLECLVIAIEGNEATLDPIYKSFSMSVSTLHVACFTWRRTWQLDPSR